MVDSPRFTRGRYQQEWQSWSCQWLRCIQAPWDKHFTRPSHPVPADEHPRTGMLAVRDNGSIPFLSVQNMGGIKMKSGIWLFESRRPLDPGACQIVRVEARQTAADVEPYATRFVRLIPGRIVFISIFDCHVNHPVGCRNLNCWTSVLCVALTTYRSRRTASQQVETAVEIIHTPTGSQHSPLNGEARRRIVR